MPNLSEIIQRKLKEEELNHQKEEARRRAEEVETRKKQEKELAACKRIIELVEAERVLRELNERFLENRGRISKKDGIFEFHRRRPGYDGEGGYSEAEEWTDTYPLAYVSLRRNFRDSYFQFVIIAYPYLLELRGGLCSNSYIRSFFDPGEHYTSDEKIGNFDLQDLQKGIGYLKEKTINLVAEKFLEIHKYIGS